MNKFVAIVLFGLLVPTGADAKDDDWTVRIGLGGAVAPDFERSKDYEAVPVPVAEVSWKDRVTLGTESGLRVNVIANDALTLGVGARVSYGGGRAEDDNSALRGLGDVDNALEVGPTVALEIGRWSFDAAARHDVGSGHGGTLVDVGAGHVTPLGDRFSLAMETGLTWASKDYMQSYFGINAEQASRSALRQRSAGAGIKNVDLTLTLTYEASENWTLGLSGGYSRLLGAAADSPLVEDRGSGNQAAGGLFAVYHFGL